MVVGTNLPLVLNNFTIQAGAWMGSSPRFQVVDFIPQSSEVLDWAKDRAFYLFGGSGATHNILEKSDPQTLARFKSEDQARLRRAVDELSADVGVVVRETEQSLRLMDGFLEHLGRLSLRLYLTSSLYGERQAYDMRARLEDGVNMVRTTLQCLKEPATRSLWVSPQVTPYIPYVSMLFLCPEFSERHFSQCYNEQRVDVEPIAYDEEGLKKAAQKILDNWDGGIPEYHLVHLWNMIHIQALSRIYGAATVYVKRTYGDESGFYKPYESDGHVLALHWRDTRVFRFDNAQGFIMGISGKKLWEVTDLALIGTMEMFREGRFRFLLIDHAS